MSYLYNIPTLIWVPNGGILFIETNINIVNVFVKEGAGFTLVICEGFAVFLCHVNYLIFIINYTYSIV